MATLLYTISPMKRPQEILDSFLDCLARDRAAAANDRAALNAALKRAFRKALEDAHGDDTEFLDDASEDTVGRLQRTTCERFWTAVAYWGIHHAYSSSPIRLAERYGTEDDIAAVQRSARIADLLFIYSKWGKTGLHPLRDAVDLPREPAVNFLQTLRKVASSRKLAEVLDELPSFIANRLPATRNAAFAQALHAAGRRATIRTDLEDYYAQVVEPTLLTRRGSGSKRDAAGRPAAQRKRRKTEAVEVGRAGLRVSASPDQSLVQYPRTSDDGSLLNSSFLDTSGVGATELGRSEGEDDDWIDESTLARGALSENSGSRRNTNDSAAPVANSMIDENDSDSGFGGGGGFDDGGSGRGALDGDAPGGHTSFNKSNESFGAVADIPPSSSIAMGEPNSELVRDTQSILDAVESTGPNPAITWLFDSITRRDGLQDDLSKAKARCERAREKFEEIQTAITHTQLPDTDLPASIAHYSSRLTAMDTAHTECLAQQASIQTFNTRLHDLGMDSSHSISVTVNQDAYEQHRGTLQTSLGRLEALQQDDADAREEVKAADGELAALKADEKRITADLEGVRQLYKRVGVVVPAGSLDIGKPV